MSDPPSEPSETPKRFDLVALKREGYPWIEDPEHPLWAEQQDGWPNMDAIAAMREAVRIGAEKGRADSRSHPAFDPGYITNAQATRPADAPVVQPDNPSREKPRR